MSDYFVVIIRGSLHREAKGPFTEDQAKAAAERFAKEYGEGAFVTKIVAQCVVLPLEVEWRGE